MTSLVQYGVCFVIICKLHFSTQEKILNVSFKLNARRFVSFVYHSVLSFLAFSRLYLSLLSSLLRQKKKISVYLRLQVSYDTISNLEMPSV